MLCLVVSKFVKLLAVASEKDGKKVMAGKTMNPMHDWYWVLRVRR